jgi:hypothetical protein
MIKNRKIIQIPEKLIIEMEIDQGNKYIISKSKIINNIAIR